MELTYEYLKETLLSGDFSRIKNKFENELVDVKERPYDLSSGRGKEELCKDVSGMLNSVGGFILLGVKGVPDPNHVFERIDEVVGVSASLNEQQYLQALNLGMYPPESLVSIKECKLDDKQIFYIQIPQGSSQKPFFRKRENGFEYWQRSGSHVMQKPIDRLHEISRKGLEYETHLMNIEANVEELVRQARVKSDENTTLDDLRREL